MINLIQALQGISVASLPKAEQSVFAANIAPISDTESQIDTVKALEWLRHVVKEYKPAEFTKLLAEYEMQLAMADNDGFNTVDETDAEQPEEPKVKEPGRIAYVWNHKAKELILVQNIGHWRDSSAKMKGFGAGSSTTIFTRTMTPLEQEQWDTQYRMRCWPYSYQGFFLDDEKKMEVDTTAPGYEIVMEHYAKLLPGFPPQESDDKKKVDGGSLKKTESHFKKRQTKEKVADYANDRILLSTICNHLYKEHHELWDELDAIEKNLSEATARRHSDKIGQLWSLELKSHFDDEEINLFPKLGPHEQNKTLISKLILEHKMIADLIEKIRSGHSVKHIKMFCELVKQHIKTEELLMSQVIPDPFKKTYSIEELESRLNQMRAQKPQATIQPGAPIDDSRDRIRLQKVAELKKIPSASTIECISGHIYIAGDDSTHLLKTDAELKSQRYFRLFPGKGRIPKMEKADIEASAVINEGNIEDPNYHLLLLGSASLPTREVMIDISTKTGHQEKISTTDFFKRLKNKIPNLNIEGMANLGGKAMVLANRGNRTHPQNHLIITSRDFYKHQADCPVHVISIVGILPELGISDLCYLPQRDILLFTASIENSADAIQDGEIGDSYLGWFEDFYANHDKSELQPTRLTNLSEVDIRFQKQKIEGICIEDSIGSSKTHYVVHLVADNDDGRSRMFEMEINIPQTKYSSRPHTLFRGGEKINSEKIKTDGISLTKDKEIASYWAGSKKGGQLYAYELSADANILEKSMVPEKFLPKSSPPDHQDKERIANYAAAQGYDGVDLSEFLNEHEVRIFNEKCLVEVPITETNIINQLRGLDKDKQEELLELCTGNLTYVFPKIQKADIAWLKQTGRKSYSGGELRPIVVDNKMVGGIHWDMGGIDYLELKKEFKHKGILRKIVCSNVEDDNTVKFVSASDELVNKLSTYGTVSYTESNDMHTVTVDKEKLIAESYAQAKKDGDNPELVNAADRILAYGNNKLESGGSLSDEEQILASRWDKKKNNIMQLAEVMRKLRYNLTTDMKSDDEKTRLTALVIALMDKTAERVGNEESASESKHFGVTGFQKKHVSIDGNRITFKYTGKSGVDHEKSLTDELIAKTLAEAIKNSPDKNVFTTSDGFKIKADRINRYLSEYGVTAKDLRGYGANKYVMASLGTIEIEKEKPARIKQFRKALKYAARMVGHGAATLKKHYLIPELEEEFIENGKIINLADFYKKGGTMQMAAGGKVKPYPIRPEPEPLIVNDTQSALNFPGSEDDVPEAMRKNETVFTGEQSKFLGEIGIYYNKHSNQEKVSIRTANQANDFFHKIWDKHTIELQESFYILYLNRQNRVIAWNCPFKGAVAGTVVDVRIIVATVAKVLASSVVVAHNHPSGNLQPSQADKKLTATLKEALLIIEVLLADSLIITPNGQYYSFANEGLLEHGGKMSKGGKFNSENEFVGINAKGKKYVLPSSHVPFVQVPAEGANCTNCLHYLNIGTPRCLLPQFIDYHGSSELPKDPENWASDWYSPAIASLLTMPAGIEIKQKGRFNIPKGENPFIRVAKGGSSCETCKFLSQDKKHCGNKDFVEWYGKSELPVPIREYCSDWYEPMPETMQAGGEITDLNSTSEYYVKVLMQRKDQYFMLSKSNPRYAELIAGLQESIDKGYLFTKTYHNKEDLVFIRPTQKLLELYSEKEKFEAGGSLQKKKAVFYHGVRREKNVEKILHEGFKLYEITPRWVNDYAISVLASPGAVRKLFGRNVPIIKIEFYGVIKQHNELPQIIASNPRNYTNEIVESGIDAVRLNGRGAQTFIYNPKAITKISLVTEDQMEEGGMLLSPEEIALQQLEIKKSELHNDRTRMYEEEKVTGFNMQSMDRRKAISRELDKIALEIIHQKNIVRVTSNEGGKLTNVPDKKDNVYENVPDFTNVNTDLISFDEETILVEPMPPYVPIINEEQFRLKGYLFDAIRISPNLYIVAANGYKENIGGEYLYKTNTYKGGRIATVSEEGFVLVTLDQLVLVNDYYYTKAKAVERKSADDKNKRTEEFYDKLPTEKRERILNQKNYYSILPVSVKKKVTQEQYEAMNLEEKEKLYKPYKRTGVKRLVSRLSEDRMWRSFHSMYERFLNPLATIPEPGFANDEVFKYWTEFRDMMNWKLKDIKIQREADSEGYKIALETSFGESNTNDALLATLGILVKRQNGDAINPVEIEEIREAWVAVESKFFILYEMALKNNLKVSHTGERMVFASKAVGMYLPKMHTIAVSAKYGEKQFAQGLAHEVTHFIDHVLGSETGKRYISDDYESLPGKIAFTFRKHMNQKTDSDYLNATKECFARAMEQYFAIETNGEQAELFQSNAASSIARYFDAPSYVSKTFYYETLRGMIEEFVNDQRASFVKKLIEYEKQMPALQPQEPVSEQQDSSNEVLDRLKAALIKTKSPDFIQHVDYYADILYKAIKFPRFKSNSGETLTAEAFLAPGNKQWRKIWSAETGLNLPETKHGTAAALAKYYLGLTEKDSTALPAIIKTQKATVYENPELVAANVFINYSYTKQVIETILKRMQTGQLWQASWNFGAWSHTSSWSNGFIYKDKNGDYKLVRKESDIEEKNWAHSYVTIEEIVLAIKKSELTLHAPFAPVIITSAKKRSLNPRGGYKMFRGITPSGSSEYVVSFSNGESHSSMRADNAEEAKREAWDWWIDQNKWKSRNRFEKKLKTLIDIVAEKKSKSDLDAIDQDKILKAWQKYWSDDEKGEDEWDEYCSDFKKISKNGGNLYRVLFVNDVNEINLVDLGGSWTLSKYNAMDIVELNFGYYGVGKSKAIIVEVETPPNNITLKGVDLEGNPIEKEVGIIDFSLLKTINLYQAKGKEMVKIENVLNAKKAQVCDNCLKDADKLTEVTIGQNTWELCDKCSAQQAQTNIFSEEAGNERKRLEDRAIAKYQWMRNADSGQKYGNQQIIVSEDEFIYEKYSKPLLVKEWHTKPFKEYLEKHGKQYALFIRKDNAGDWILFKFDSSVDRLLPKYGIEKGWAIKVLDFNSPEATRQGKTSDRG